MEPQETRREIVEIITKALNRSLTDQEINVLYELGNADIETRKVFVNLFKEMKDKIDFWKED